MLILLATEWTCNLHMLGPWLRFISTLSIPTTVVLWNLPPAFTLGSLRLGQLNRGFYSTKACTLPMPCTLLLYSSYARTSPYTSLQSSTLGALGTPLHFGISKDSDYLGLRHQDFKNGLRWFQCEAKVDKSALHLSPPGNLRPFGSLFGALKK